MGPADVEHEAATADGGRSQGLVLDADGAPIQTARTGG
jgi:hypothetical protein